jgi:hypothetical protein
VLVAGALLAGGCERIWQLDEVSDARPGTGDGGGDGSTGPCFSDDFGGTAIKDQWVIKKANGTNAQVQNGELVLTLTQGTGDLYAQIEGPTDDFTDDIVEIEVTGVPDQTTTAEAGLSIETTPDDRFMVLIAATGIIWRRSTPALGDDDVSVGYTPADHRFLRIRHEGGVVYWEWRSGTEGAWSIGRKQTEAPTALQNKRIIVFGGTYEVATAPPGTAHFDNLARTCR